MKHTKIYHLLFYAIILYTHLPHYTAQIMQRNLVAASNYPIPPVLKLDFTTLKHGPFDKQEIKAGRKRLTEKNFNYFEDPLEYLHCDDHVRNLTLGYSCFEDPESEAYAQENLFLVENNFQKYFMKIRRNVTVFELGLEKSLRSYSVMLKILQHKVIKNTFVGIYKFEKNRGSLKDAVMSGQLTQYDKYSYMLNIARILRTIHFDRDPKTSDLDINLSPSNFLLMEKMPYSVELIDLIEGREDFRKDHVDELTLLGGQKELIRINYMLDARARNVFGLGRLFFFICFEELLDSADDFDPENLKTLNSREGQLHRSHFNEKFMNVLRGMLNGNPIDRPKLEVVIDLLEEQKKRAEFLMQGIHEVIKRTYVKMTREVQQETFLNIEMQSHDPEKFKKVNLEDKMLAVKGRIMKLAQSVSKKYQKKLKDKYLKYREFFAAEVISQMKRSTLKFMNKPSDKFGMINDMDNLDKLVNLDEKPAPRSELVNPNTDQLFLNDFIDLLNIADDLSFSDVKTQRVTFASFHSGMMNIIGKKPSEVDPSEAKIFNIRKMFMFEVFLTINELFEKHFNVKKKAFLKFVRSVVHKKEEMGNSLEKVPYIIVIVISQLFIFGCIAMLFLRKSNYAKYQKKTFSTYVRL